MGDSKCGLTSAQYRGTVTALVLLITLLLIQVSAAYFGKLTQPKPGMVFSALSDEIMQEITIFGTSYSSF